MGTIKDIVYAGFGIASEIKGKAEEKYNSLIEAGKKHEQDNGKDKVSEFFNTIEETTEKYSPKLDELKAKIEGLKPEFLKKNEVEVEK